MSFGAPKIAPQKKLPAPSTKSAGMRRETYLPNGVAWVLSIACYNPVFLSVGAIVAGYAQGTIKEARLLLPCTMWLVDRLLSFEYILTNSIFVSSGFSTGL